MAENACSIGVLVKSAMDNLESGSLPLTENQEAVLSRIRGLLATSYENRPELLELIDKALNNIGKSDKSKERSLALASHFLSYRPDITEMAPDNGQRYIQRIKKHFSKKSFAQFNSDHERERYLSSKSHDLVRRLEDNPWYILERDGGLEKYIEQVSDYHFSPQVNWVCDNFKKLIDVLEGGSWRHGFYHFRHKSHNFCHDQPEIDKGQVSLIPDQQLDEILGVAETKKILKTFKCTELVWVDTSLSTLHSDNWEREEDYINMHSLYLFEPFPYDEEGLASLSSESPPRPDLIQRWLCHELLLGKKEKKVFDAYLAYQKKQLENLKEVYCQEDIELRRRYGLIDEKNEKRLKKQSREIFDMQTEFWLSMVGTSINCLLDQGYKIPKIIRIVENELNPLKCGHEEIAENLKPILERCYHVKNPARKIKSNLAFDEYF